MKKREGKIETVITFFFVLFVVAILIYVLQIHIFQNLSMDMEDALAASNLASAVIDIQEYGISENLIIANPQDAFETYQDALKVNMELDDTWYSSNPAITEPVVIEEYIVYNVYGDDVEIYHFGSNDYSQVIIGGKGTVTAPNGKIIETTSIYSKISFWLDGFFHIRVPAKKDKLVDIIS